MLRSLVTTLAVTAFGGWALTSTATHAPAEQPLAPTVGASPKKSRALAQTAPSADKPRPVAVKKQRPQSPPPGWVMRAPARATQKEKSVRARGVNPCLTPDPGFGNYGPWDRSPSVGQMIIPQHLTLDASGAFPVMFHFHGHEAARKEWVQAVDGAVLVGIDVGNNSGPYLRKFGSADSIKELLRSVERGVAAELGVARAKIGKLGLSSWSAGYGAVEQILRSTVASRVDALILLDGLHTGPADSQRAAVTLAPFVAYAERAAHGEGLMYVSHSSIVPPGYASTTETANYLMWQLGGEPEQATRRRGDPMGLELIRQYSEGSFHVRGFSGNGKLDHCAHLGLYRKVLREQLAPRWELPLAEL